MKAPYEQFTEARSGQGVFTFLTGEGGFLQEFLYGYTGLRWRQDRLGGCCPAAGRGLRITGLRWRGGARPPAGPVDLQLAPGARAGGDAGRDPLGVGGDAAEHADPDRRPGRRQPGRAAR